MSTDEQASHPWNLESPLSAVPAAVDTQLQKYLQQSQQEFSHINPLVDGAIAVLRDFIVNGGKRVRPTFAWAGIRAALEGGGGSLDALCGIGMDAPSSAPAELSAHSTAVLNALSSFEFIQACALIHDDIIDRSDTRRGFPTAHRTFESRHRERGWLGSSQHYGVSQAILIGDLAFAWADDLYNGSGLSINALHRARPAWRAMRTEVIAGQILDIAVEANGSEDVADSFAVIKYKTASYTVARPLHIGAALAGAGERTVNMLRNVGQDIGEAFQLRDDQLGVFGDPEVTGKPSGDDLRTGKRTTLINEALRRGDAAQATALRKGLGKGEESTEADIERLRDIIHDTGAQAEVEKLIEARTQRAIESLRAGGLGADITTELTQLAEKLTHRRF
ncbi:polyprenyl synthetase family protein [Corynebacterium sp. c9Ua_112]|uniref:Polyprenyl synthetase family protein n=1 Tax=Corynebacterium macclintockiae TaxID=2913501 RepID=A0A9X3M8K8_9CORY|nr:polyprenyl synthetase family protein [Corynebacterium macclintockiae]MCZ9305035.1 polyprenyl synthetase family protein [Corynebacterium macclintockiae]